jgi:hypothetical protein
VTHGITTNWQRQRLERMFVTIFFLRFFCSSIEDCLRASAPLIVLRAVDADERPVMPEVSALMNVVKEKINLSFNTQNKAALLKKILDIIFFFQKRALHILH